MIGLTWGDPSLTLTPGQWAAVLGNCAAWLLQWRAGYDPRIVAGLTCGLLFSAFWNAPIGRDSALLFEQARALHDLSWAAFLETFYQRAYIEYQTPFVPFYVSRFPAVWRHQLYLLPLALVNCGLLAAVFGQWGALICATPLLAIMQTQPGPDILLFSALLVSMRLAQLGQRGLAAVVYGLAYLIKPLVLVTGPLMIAPLGLWGLVAFGIWGGYVGLSSRYPFGRHQLAFLAHQLLIKQAAGRGRPRADWQAGALWWRWRIITAPTLPAAPWYLFPAGLARWTWRGVLLALGILLGCGNIKYLLLALLFVFPVESAA